MNMVTLPAGNISVPALFIAPGQTLTVWMCSNSADGYPRKQVELRVTPGGQAQIFTSGDIALRGFSTWRSNE